MNIIFPDIVSYDDMRSIGNKSFTNRQIDVISLLLTGSHEAQSNKDMANLLLNENDTSPRPRTITEKAVETHISNVVAKIKDDGDAHYDSRRIIKKYVSAFPQHKLLKKHGENLLKEAAFRRLTVKLPISDRKIFVYDLREEVKAICDKNYHSFEQFIEYIEWVQGEKISQKKFSLPHFIKMIDNKVFGAERIFCVVSREFMKNIEQNLSHVLKKESSLVLLCFDETEIRDNLTYYQGLITFLKIVSGDNALDKIDIYDTSITTYQSHKNLKVDKTLETPNFKKFWTIAVVIIIVGGFGILAFSTFYIKDKKNIIKISSDFLLPHANLVLQRPKILEKIDYAIRQQNGIKSAAIVGIGGSGKTTIVNQFVSRKSSQIIWFVKASNKDTIFSSYKDLLFNFHLTQDDIKIIKNNSPNTCKEAGRKNMILLLKRKLRSSPGWVLVYDDVKNIYNIQGLIPSNPSVWGEGTVLITSRDQNLSLNQYIGKIIKLNELSKSEKKELFTKIYPNDSSSSPEFLDQLLESIPPYPLDIVVSASYLKNNSITLKAYLNLLDKQNINIHKLHTAVLKSIGMYGQTRYSIVNLAIENIINENKKFSKLLFLISLFDNYRIPKILLELIVEKSLIEVFIHQLNKYSLTTSFEEIEGFSTFTIHDETHKIMKEIFKNETYLGNKELFLKEFSSDLLKRISKTVYEETDLPQTKAILNHCSRFIKNSHIPKKSQLWENITSEIGRAYFYLGDYYNAQKFLEENFKNYKIKKQNKILANPSSSLRLLSFLGDLYGDGMRAGAIAQDTRKIKEVIHYMEKEIKDINKNKELLGETLVYIGLSYTHLAIIQHEQKYIKQIKKFCNNPSKLSKIALVNPFNYTCKKTKELFKLADIYTKNGASLLIKNQSSPLYRKRYAASLHYRGLLSVYLDKFKEGFNCLAEGNKLYSKYDQNNIRTGWSHLILGLAYTYMEKYKQASTNLKKALLIYKKHTNSKNPRILMIENLYAYNLIMENKIKEAKKIILNIINTGGKDYYNRYRAFRSLIILSNKELEKHSKTYNKKQLSLHLSCLCSSISEINTF